MRPPEDSQPSGPSIISISSTHRWDPDLVWQTDRWKRYLWSNFVNGSSETCEIIDDGTECFPQWSSYMREVFTRLHSDEPEKLEKPAAGAQRAEAAHDAAGALPGQGQTSNDRLVGSYPRGILCRNGEQRFHLHLECRMAAA